MQLPHFRASRFIIFACQSQSIFQNTCEKVIFRAVFSLFCRTLSSRRVSSRASKSNDRRNLLDKVLIANRGEIACRIMKTAKLMGIKMAAVYSDADVGAMHVQMADEAFRLGPPTASESYLNSAKIIEAAKRCGAHAIHPGYGFLSENAEFAELCERENLIFIGPPSSAIRDMGLKNRAKSLMHDAGVPVIVGYHGADQCKVTLKKEAERIGYPVMLKAVRGGGGKGMRIATTPDEFDSQLESARRESMKSFGNDDMIVEKFVKNPRHVEVQVFGDQHGNYVYLFERDCSVQRRHQKIIEEAPAPGISNETRVKLGEAAVKAAAAVDYVGAGTVEFIMDPGQNFYFMEMNTRLQVEHPVTEMITGFDLVEWQFRVARGEHLPVTDQHGIVLNGHSFEARIYAEDPENDFMPCTGHLHYLHVPDQTLLDRKIRIETGIQQGDEVSIHYDPMISKLVVWSFDRMSALKKLDEVLTAYQIVGLKTNVNFLHSLANHPEFQLGNVYTDFIKDHYTDFFPTKSATTDTVDLDLVCKAALGIVLAEKISLQRSKSIENNRSDPFNINDSFRVNLAAERRIKLKKGDNGAEFVIHIRRIPAKADELYEISCAKKSTSVRVTKIGHHTHSDVQVIEFVAEMDKSRAFRIKIVQTYDKITLFCGDTSMEFELSGPELTQKDDENEISSGCLAPMPGVIEKIMVKPGQAVQLGDALIVMVAMKMEYIIKAPKMCVVENVLCKVGDNVAKNANLVTFSKNS